MIINIFKWSYCITINSKTHYYLLPYLGDFSCFLGGIRKYILISALILSLLCSYIIYLFNFNNRQQWIKVFYCLNGKLTPQEIEIYNPKAMHNIFLWTKLLLILSKIGIYVLLIIAICTYIYKPITESESIIHLIAWLIWLIPNFLSGYTICGTIEEHKVITRQTLCSSFNKS